MREEEVPQEGNATLAGHRKAVYASGSDGRVRLVASAGWEVEEIVTRLAVDQFDALTREAQTQAIAGAASPLAFHMYRRRMDEALLSQATGIWVWRIRRHFRPEIFAQLSPRILGRYAAALGIGVDELRRVDALASQEGGQRAES